MQTASAVGLGTVNTPLEQKNQSSSEQKDSSRNSGEQAVPYLDFDADPVSLTAALVDIASPSHDEKNIADAIESALNAVRKHAAIDFVVQRYNNTVCAKTNTGRDTRVVLAGHVDTVPIADNVPHHLTEDADGQTIMHGCGTTDMKSGLAVYLHVFARLVKTGNLSCDLTMIAYEGEEVATKYNGLYHLQRDHPEWLAGDLALLGEPSGGIIEAGCQGTLRLKISACGQRAHSARSWLGSNAAHTLAPVMVKVADYEARKVTIDGCTYREGLNIVHLEAGVATNTIPDDAWMFVNFRYAPDRSEDDALAHALEVLGLRNLADDSLLSVEIDDSAGAALPGLGAPVAKRLLEAVGGNYRAKLGWTDVARFSALGVPAVNFGCGDPGFAHKRDEQCPTAQIIQVAQQLVDYLQKEELPS